jgi:lipopolysaccharide/colanic/teichoic acid biosynthesis glycosyltransferase
VRHLAGRLNERRRLTDDLGWFDTRRIAALLPDTVSSGAHRFAQDVLATMGPEGVLFPVEILTHPWGEDGPRGNSPRDGGETNSLTGPEGTAPAVPIPMKGEAVPVQTSVKSLDPHFLLPQPVWKRAMDIVGSILMLLLSSPLFLIVAIAVKLDSPGSVFFHQPRAGRGGRPFMFHKFRSMYVDAEERKKALEAKNEVEGPIFKIRNDPRITRVGRIIRRTSIDELPQLWNVLMGNMSLVGPRPPTLDEVPNYEPWQARRLELLGGMTCIWQVSGRSEIGFEDWMRMDLRYLRHRSFLTDLGLLWRTIGAVFSRRGAY